MKLPEIKNTPEYVGLYVVDFGDTSTVGFTAGEVGQLLESERFKDIKVYKIYNAASDGTMELKGVPNDIFGLEMGLFFYSGDKQTVTGDYQRLVDAAVKNTPPAMANVQMAKFSSGKYATAIIYPAECNEEFSRWLIDIDYKTSGIAGGGIDAVNQYHADKPEILRSYQLFGKTKFEEMATEQLLEATKRAVAR
ncbi:MAG: hypothetical protein K8R02_03165 [Anaerohalosphaeraceae bacterium]|nr:hypothetical protein [Anaerohalosphaeraceae bacterium]